MGHRVLHDDDSRGDDPPSNFPLEGLSDIDHSGGDDPPSNSSMEGVGGRLRMGHTIEDDDYPPSNYPIEGGEEREIYDDDSGGDGLPSDSPMEGIVGGLHMGHSIEEDDEEVQWPKKQRRTTEEQNQGSDQVVDEREEEEQASDAMGRQAEAIGDYSVFATLTAPEVLDCRICFQHLRLPVFECQKGHLACSSCCSKLGNKCPCSSLVGFYRNRGVEKILESVKIPCQNMKYGCKEMVFLSKRHDHQHKCFCVPCSCPLPDCDFVGSSKNLSLHFIDKHRNSAKRFCYNDLITISLDKQHKYFILQEEAEGSLFIVNNGLKPYGNAINVSCIGRMSTNTVISYDLTVGNGDSSIILESFIEFAPARVEHAPLERFLLVPNDFVSSCGKLKLQLLIRRYQPKSSAIH